ncbi:unnamed protein product [Somion occarium]|uniref:Uncharacterized protein n=1 Tax=Somion occarium TaxID=3059160 RepID=A0ABP1CXS3_9APHY
MPTHCCLRQSSERNPKDVPRWHRRSLETYSIFQVAELYLFPSDSGTIERTTRPTIDEFLDVLEGCPALEKLEILGTSPSLDERTATYPEPARRTHLQYLKSLRLFEKPVHVAHILAHLIIPRSADIELMYDFGTASDIMTILPRNIDGLQILCNASILARSASTTTRLDQYNTL